MTIKEFLNNDCYFDSYRKRRNWNGFIVYHVWSKSNKGTCVGLSQFALDDGKTIRFATNEEILILIDFYKESLLLIPSKEYSYPDFLFNYFDEEKCKQYCSEQITKLALYIKNNNEGE